MMGRFRNTIRRDDPERRNHPGPLYLVY